MKLPYDWVYGLMNCDGTDPKKALWEENGKELQAVEEYPKKIISEVRKRLKGLDSGFLLNPNSIVATVIYCPGKSTQEVCKRIQEISSGIGKVVYSALGTDMFFLVITGNSAAEKEAAKEGFPYHVTPSDPRLCETWMLKAEMNRPYSANDLNLNQMYAISANPNPYQFYIDECEKCYLQYIINEFFTQKPLKKEKLEIYLKELFDYKMYSHKDRAELIAFALANRGIVLPKNLLEKASSQEKPQEALDIIWKHLLQQPYLFIDRSAEAPIPAPGASAPRGRTGQR